MAVGTSVPKLTVEIYEGDAEGPTVTHVFHGETRDRVLEVEKAHRASDKFYDAAAGGGRYEGIELRTTRSWGRG